jgi:hypothetical protein
MNEQVLIAEVLEKHFPDECALAGPANVRKIAEGDVKFVRTEHSADMDLTQVLTILAAVAGILNNALSVYKNWGGSKPPEKTELREAVEATSNIPSGVKPDELEGIYEYLLQRLRATGNRSDKPTSAEVPEAAGDGK